MKRLLITTLVILVVPLLSFSQDISSKEMKIDNFEPDAFKTHMYQHSNNPCKDSLYLELKEKPLAEMSDREYEIFKQKDKACQEYMNTVEQTEPQKQNAETLENANKAANVYYVIGGISVLISTIYLLTI